MRTAAFLLTLTIAAAVQANPFAYTWQQLAPGVWAGIREEPFALPQEGNAVFVVTSDGVVLFDAGGSPAMGEAIVAKVRSVTAQPITHVVLSHWHGDHMRGLQAIRAAYPRVEILAHPHVRELITQTEEKWLKRRVSMAPNARKAVEGALAQNVDLRGRALIPAEKEWLEAGLRATEQLDQENNRTTYVEPTGTIAGTFVLYLGGRELQFLHLGNAHTAGDLVLWLPKEKIVATGDVVTAPIPLMPSAYTADYGQVLAKLEALGFTTLVPGHGAIQSDASYVDLLAELVRTVSAQMTELVAKGHARDDAIAKIDFSAVERRFTHGDAFLAHRFDDYVRTTLPDCAYQTVTSGAPKESF